MPNAYINQRELRFMEVIHVSAECYPVAKVGGLGDVVGALPKYQQKAGIISKVVMPCYKTRFLQENEFEVVHQGGTWLGRTWFHFNVLKEKTNKLGFDLYLLDIPGLLDKEGVYGHHNDVERFCAFQIAVLDWLNEWVDKPDIVHCHDHHAGLIPFMMGQSYKFETLKHIPTVFTVHNGQYQGQFGWDLLEWIPGFDLWKSGLLDWNGSINPLASAIKCAWKINAVSSSYMEEMQQSFGGLEALLQQEKSKCLGILNGIDEQVWDPQNDPMIPKHYTSRTASEGKKENKLKICQQFNLDPEKPLISFIGRLVGEKGADLLSDIIGRSLYETNNAVNFLVLGSGEPHVEWSLHQLKHYVVGHYNDYIGYNETLSHQIYAASDFILMPSRVEPCGLNQMYAMRYGTIPMVRRTGGLKDTVVDFGEQGGYGICFNHASVWDVCHAVKRASELFSDASKIQDIRKHIMKLDFSWEQSAAKYIELYKSLKR